jgi:ribosomal protein S18 acetylase RimI-like enzyme
MCDVIIREFIPEKSAEDLALLLPAFLRIWNAKENLKFVCLTLRPFDEAQARGMFARHLAGGVRYFGAVDARSEIRGILVTRTSPCEGFEFANLGVQPEYKRKGIGRALIRHALHLAEQEGFRAVEGKVFADDIPMLRLALDLGFQPVRMDYGRRADGANLVHMKRCF